MEKKEIQKQIEVLEITTLIMKLYQDHLPEETYNSVIFGLNRVLEILKWDKELSK
jgi:hypothetical protein